MYNSGEELQHFGEELENKINVYSLSDVHKVTI